MLRLLSNLCLTSLVIFKALSSVKARHIPPSYRTDIWQPETGTREVFFRCKGQPCDQYYRSLEQLHSLQEQMRVQEGVNHDMGDPTRGCIVYTEEQTEALTRRVHADRHREHSEHNREHREHVEHNREHREHAEHNRVKRKLNDFEEEPMKLWHNDIVYLFDGTHDDEEKEKIRAAFRTWEESTCINFEEEELENKDNLTEEYILLSKEIYGCFSFVGKTGSKSQLINLSSPCLYLPGTAIHEIGHTLGLWHEHQRADRDEWISVNYDNIGYYASQFYTQKTVSHGIPYDFSSVMQYSPHAGSSNGRETITAKNPLFQTSMGQRVELSYLDRKMINYAYCNASCLGSPKPTCENGGYQNPRHCDACICPDGFSGELCSDAALSVGEECGGILTLKENEEMFISSPEYENNFYENSIECSWIIQTTSNRTINMEFVEEFGVYQYNGQVCAHWLEVKYGDSLEYPGPRFCGQERPDIKLTSKGSKIALIFKTINRVDSSSLRRGFKMKLSLNHVDETANTTNITWSDWSECNRECACGGCSERTRYAICNGMRCTGELEKTETEPCTRVCTKGDVRSRHGSTVDFPCPRCCGEYKAGPGATHCRIES